MIINFIVSDNVIVINVKNGELLADNAPDIDIQANSIHANADGVLIKNHS